MGEEDHYEVFIAVCPHQSAGVASVAEGIRGKILPARWVGLDGDSIPAECSSVFIRQAILSLVKLSHSRLLVDQGSIPMESLVEVDLHVGLKILGN